MRHPFTPGEVDGIEFGKTAAPNGRRSAEEPQAAVPQRILGLPYVVAVIEVGDRGLVVEPA